MALSRADHKRIALSVASELKKVLGHANGDRLVSKHKARKAPPKVDPVAEPPVGEDELIEALGMGGEAECECGGAGCTKCGKGKMRGMKHG